jgi:hypothetical protein
MGEKQAAGAEYGLQATTEFFFWGRRRRAVVHLL